jgi:DNA-directed RNA polymerase subunit H (RpoH/RPB5)
METTLNSSILTEIYKSRKIILEILKTQGYDVEDHNSFTINEINTMKHNNQLDMLLEEKIDINTDPDSNQENKNKSNKKKIYIRYYFEKSIKLANLQNMITDLFDLSETLTKDDTLFIIKQDNINETLTADLKHLWENDRIFIVIENITDLQFNKLNHILVPKHRILNDNEVSEVMKKYNITNKIQFPEISRFDPIARLMVMRPGQVCHIIRPSKPAIEADYYRICV